MTEFAVKQTVQRAEELATQLPDPVGYKILCAVPETKETFGDSKIIKSDKDQFIEQQTTMVLYVIKIGHDAYKDKIKFPHGPWCKEGDFIIARAYSGTRLKIHGKEFRIINDDSVDATVENPVGIGRAG